MDDTLPDGFKMTVLGPIPEEWDLNKLEYLVDIKGGKRLPKGHEFSSKITSYPYIRIVDFHNFSVKINELKYITSEDREKIKRYIITSEDVYISIAGTIGLVGTIPQELDGANLTENAARLIINNKNDLDRNYLVNYLTSSIGQYEIDSRTTKTSQPKLALTRIKQISIPLPPLPEQQKIAHVLSTIQTARERTEAVIQAAKELKRSMMKYLFTYGPVPVCEALNVPLRETEIGLVPDDWEIKSLGNVTELIMGQSPPGDTYNEVGNGIPFLQGKTEFQAISPIHLKYTSKPLKIAPKNSVLMSVRAPVGDVNIANINYCIGRGLASISLVDGNNIYLFYLLDYVKKNIEKEGTGSTFKAINKTKLENIKLLLPKLNIQNEIANNLINIQLKIESEQNKKQALDELFKTMLDNLMTGRKRVNNLELGVKNDT